MRQTSSHTRALIDQLIEPVSLWERLKSSRDDAAVLSEIGNSSEPAAIIDILPFILAGRRDVAAAAATAVHKLILGTTGTELAWLDWAPAPPFTLLRRSLLRVAQSVARAIGLA